MEASVCNLTAFLPVGLNSYTVSTLWTKKILSWWELKKGVYACSDETAEMHLTFAGSVNRKKTQTFLHFKLNIQSSLCCLIFYLRTKLDYPSLLLEYF